VPWEGLACRRPLRRGELLSCCRPAAVEAKVEPEADAASEAEEGTDRAPLRTVRRQSPLSVAEGDTLSSSDWRTQRAG
jgi:hypothetical protein